MTLGILAKAKQNRKDKFNREFISLFDSVIYLGEPLDEALEYIIEIAPNQSKLYLTPNGCEVVTIHTGYGDLDFNDSTWRFGFDGLFAQALNFYEITKHLTICIKQGYIETTSPIYNLGFGKKRFLECLQLDGIDLKDPKDLENAISPTPIFSDDGLENVDIYTFQSIIDERDELRRLVDELKKQGKPKHTKPQGDDLLILGAVMETLANEKVNPYTQKLLIDKIIERFGNIKGISESTLTKKFSDSKDYIRKENEILL